jgi:AcrR family transcriptional regulator
MADRDQLHAAQHQRLLAGLAQSIRDKGLGPSQVSDIVRHAKASRRTFYNHFADKDACFVELAETTSMAVMKLVAASIDSDTPLEAQIDIAVDMYVTSLMSDPALTVTFYSPGLSEKMVLAQRQGMERYAELLVAAVRIAAERDERVAAISLTRAFMLISGLAHAVGRALDRGEDLREVGDEVKQVMKAVVVAPAATAPPVAPVVTAG